MKKININLSLTLILSIFLTFFSAYKSYKSRVPEVIQKTETKYINEKDNVDTKTIVPLNWTTYSSQKFGFSISYPPNWSLDDSYAVYSGKVVRLTSFSEKPTVTSRDLEIVIGSNEVYSTSGSVCVNRSCQEVQISKIKINNKALEVPVIESSYQNKFEHYTFSITEDYLPPIYVSYHEPSELSEVVNILATIKPL